MNFYKHHHPNRRSVARVMVFIFFLGIVFPLAAQQQNRTQTFSLQHQLKISPTLLSEEVPLFTQPTVGTELTLSENGIWLPEFARENPAGHAPLCRMEVRLENQMTVPVWIRAGEFDALPQFGSGNLYVRMKLLRF